MHKRTNNDREREEAIRKRRIRNNWIVAAASLGLALFFYFFLDGIIESFMG